MRLGIAVLVLLTVACGNDTPSGPSAQQPETARLSGSVTAGSCARPIPGITPITCVRSHDFTPGRAGTMTATLTWTGTTDMDLVLTASSCGTYDSYNCTVLAQARTGSGSERVTLAVSRGERLRFWAHNNSPADGEYTIDVRIE